MSSFEEEMEEEMNKAQQAYSVKAFHCLNPECLRTHVALKDKNGKVFAHFVMPDDFLKILQDFAYLSAVERS